MEEQLFSFHFPDCEDQADQDDQNLTNFEQIEKDGKKQFRCTIPNCGKIFKFKSEIMRHQVIHLNDRPYICTHEGCKKAFKRPDALEIHSRIHTKETPYICEAPGCGLKFTTRSGLRYHLLKHNEQKPYYCTFPGCDKSFITPAQLRQHERATNFHQKIVKKKAVETPIEPAMSKVFPALQTPSMPVVQNPATIPFMPSKCMKEQPTYQDRLYDDFGDVTMAPRPAKVMEWQVRNQDEVEKYNNDKKQEDFEKVLKVLVQENKLLKQKLQMCDQLMGAFNENHSLKTQLTKQEKVEEKEPSLFFDENEFLFLDFLKQKDNGSY